MDTASTISPRPVVSIITPAFNVEAFAGSCIESVLRQSFREFEMLLVDDGSTDATAEVADAHARRDPRIRVIRISNHGVSHARNVAMSHARGRLFAFLDADDQWDPAFLAEQLAVLERNPDMSVVTGNALNLGSSLDGLPVRSWPHTLQEITLVDMLEREDVVFIMSVFERRIFETIGGFDERLHRSEDYDFWLRAAAVGYRFIANPRPLGCYRRRAGSASTDEAAMLAGVVDVLGRVETLCGPGRVVERAAAERRRRHFEHRYLLATGKAALLKGRFARAASCFRELRRIHPTMRLAVLAAVARLAPGLLRWAYRVKLACHASLAEIALRRRGRVGASR